MQTVEKIRSGNTYLGIEFGSTRIKAVLIDDTYAPIASGAYDWENKLENGYWTYSQEKIIAGLQGCYADLVRDIKDRYNAELETVGAMGISAMMHGYLAFDENDELLVPFRTWRNTTTAQAADKLTKLFGFNIPQRWSIAHLYQAVLNGEEHVPEIRHITTLAGYIHYLLTGERTVGAGEAAGMFPIDSDSCTYNEDMLTKFEELMDPYGYSWNIRKVLPVSRSAGTKSAVLTDEGAKLLDVSGKLKGGIPMCPPEGDAGTGMVATNSVLPRTGNVSAGTSIFSMVVLEKPLKNVYTEIDVVATPDGKPVAMVHCNNCCSELDAWVKLFGEFAQLAGMKLSKGELYTMLYKNTLTADADCGGVTAYNFLSGEPVAEVEQGRPMYFRTPDGNFNLANFMRAQLYSAMATLKIGMDILTENEKVPVDKLTGHGGLFKVERVAQQYMADAFNTDVSVMKTAGEGGAWGMALLAAYMNDNAGESLPAFLDAKVFASMESSTVSPDNAGTEGFDSFMTSYRNGLAAQIAAGNV